MAKGVSPQWTKPKVRLGDWVAVEGRDYTLTYAGHVQTYGDVPAVRNGAAPGTTRNAMRTK